MPASSSVLLYLVLYHRFGSTYSPNTVIRERLTMAETE